MNGLFQLVRYGLLVCALLLLGMARVSWGQEGDFSLNGKVLLDDRISTHNGDLHWQEYRLRLNPSYTDGVRYKFYADVWARRLVSSSAFEKKPREVYLREAYVALYDFLFKNLDVTVGRQRVAWGSADRLNPTDNVNPVQLEDFWDLSRHSARSGLHARYYLGRFTFSGVYLPQFAPSNLPLAKWLDLLTGDLPRVFRKDVPVLGSVDIVADPLGVHRRYVRPDWSLHSSTYALRVAADLGVASLSASWLRGPSHLPHLSGVDVVGSLRSLDPVAGCATVKADATLWLSYPLRHVFGLDVASSIGSVGVWGEVGAFLPEDRVMAFRRFSIDPNGMVPGLGMLQSVQSDTLTLDATPFFKYTVGGDYTFPINLYLNVQYAHGLAHEEGDGNLHDYVAWVLEWRSGSERLKVSPLNGMLRIDSFARMGDTYALFLLPEIAYSPIDNCTIRLGAHLLIPGKDSKLFRAREYSEAFCKVLFMF